MSLSGEDAGAFVMSDATGGARKISFMDEPNFEVPADRNGDNIYMVTVVATDRRWALPANCP